MRETRVSRFARRARCRASSRRPRSAGTMSATDRSRVPCRLPPLTGMDMKGMDMGKCQEMHSKCMGMMGKDMDMGKCMQMHGKEMKGMNMGQCMEMMDKDNKASAKQPPAKTSKGPSTKAPSTSSTQ